MPADERASYLQLYPLHSAALSCTQLHSAALSCTQRHSAALSGIGQAALLVASLATSLSC